VGEKHITDFPAAMKASRQRVASKKIFVHPDLILDQDFKSN